MGQLRVSAGRLKGRRLTVPGGVRPTGARMREALFSLWAEQVPGARFLDLFAGSGAMALEAWSRGASGCLLLESNERVLATLRSNCRIADSSEVRVARARLPGQLPAVCRRFEPGFELAFADPPYRFEQHEALVVAVTEVLLPGGRFGLEHPARAEPPERSGPLIRLEVRRYGDSLLSIYGSG